MGRDHFLAQGPAKIVADPAIEEQRDEWRKAMAAAFKTLRAELGATAIDGVKQDASRAVQENWGAILEGKTNIAIGLFVEAGTLMQTKANALLFGVPPEESASELKALAAIDELTEPSRVSNLIRHRGVISTVATKGKIL